MVQAPPPPPLQFLPPLEEARAAASNKQGRIEIAVFSTFLAFTIILILGRLRPRGNKWFKMGSSILFMGADKLITYITGLTGQLSAASDLYVLWIAFLAYLSTLATNNSCYTLVDNEEQKKNLVVQFAVSWGLIVGTLQASLAAPEIMVPVAFIFSISVLKIRERRRALLAATRSTFGMAKATRVISDFSIYKKTQNQIMQGLGRFPYFVALRDDTYKERYEMTQENITEMKDELVNFSWNDFITTKNVLEMNEEQGMKFRETCFSFAMFWLLLARIAGYYNVDVRVDFNELRKPSITKDEETATLESITSSPFPLVSQQKEEAEEEVLFRLVEQELEFLYDYLYTDTYAIYARGICKKIVHFGIIVLFFVLALPLIVEYRTQDHNAVYVLLWGQVLDTGFTRFVIIAIFVSEFSQFGIFLTSNWGKVIYACARLRRESTNSTSNDSAASNNTNTSYMTPLVNLIEIWMIRIACLITLPTFKFACSRSTCCAKVKLGQYSIEECYNKIPFLLWFRSWIGGYVELPRRGQTGKEDIALSSFPELKTAVVSSIKRHKGKFTKGEASLKANGVSDKTIIEYLAKYTSLQSQASLILIWHIATSRFERDPSKKPQSPQQIKNFQVATKISKYCAYLVAFAPQMIPGHGGDVHTAQCEFDQVVHDLKIQEGPADLEKKRLLKEDEDSILNKGTRLQEVLFLNCSVPHDSDHLWKTLAEFWTEMLMFLALCSDHRNVVDAHANRLSVGGEFITHIWAILKHKGCQPKVVTIVTNKKTQPSSSNTTTIARPTTTTTTTARPTTTTTTTAGEQNQADEAEEEQIVTFSEIRDTTTKILTAAGIDDPFKPSNILDAINNAAGFFGVEEPLDDFVEQFE